MIALPSAAPIPTQTLTPPPSSILSQNRHFLNLPKLTHKLPTKSFSRLVPRAQNNTDENPTVADGDEEGKNNGRPRLNLKWLDLVLDPDPDNVVAVGLTGVLAWASVQVLWQLFFISLSILVAALKYSFIAALLVFILITLL